MYALMILLALQTATTDAAAFAQCAHAARKIGICREGRAALFVVNGGYSSRITLVDRHHIQGGAVCQPGVEEPCEFRPHMRSARPKDWSVEQTSIDGDFRYCLTERPKSGHLPIGCLTRARDLVWRRFF